MLSLPPTDLYLNHQGKTLTGYVQGGKIFLDETHIQLGEFYSGQSSDKLSSDKVASLNLCQQRLLRSRAHIYEFLGNIEGGDIMLQDVLYDAELFRYLSDTCGYHVIVVPISRTSPPWCMVILTKKPVDTIQITPLYQHNGQVAAFHSAYSDRSPLAKNNSTNTAATYLMIHVKDAVAQMIGNAYLPCTIGGEEREKNLSLLSGLVSRHGGIIAGDWNIYGTAVDDILSIPYPFNIFTKYLPDSLARTLGIHRNGDIARYPLGIAWNIITHSDKKERGLLQSLAKDNETNLKFPDTPTIRKGPIGMTLDGILVPRQDNWSISVMDSSLSDHRPIIAKK